MLTDTILFYIFALLVLGGAVLTITRQQRHARGHLADCLPARRRRAVPACNQAEFLFAVQIVLYVGGIMVLFLFVIMLVNLDRRPKSGSSTGSG